MSISFIRMEQIYMVVSLVLCDANAPRELKVWKLVLTWCYQREESQSSVEGKLYFTIPRDLVLI